MKKLETITEQQLLFYAKLGLTQIKEDYTKNSKQSRERTRSVLKMYDEQLEEIRNRLNEINNEEI